MKNYFAKRVVGICLLMLGLISAWADGTPGYKGSTAGAVTTNSFAKGGLWDSSGVLVGYEAIQSIVTNINYNTNIVYFHVTGDPTRAGIYYRSNALGVVWVNNITNTIGDYLDGVAHYWEMATGPYRTDNITGIGGYDLYSAISATPPDYMSLQNQTFGTDNGVGSGAFTTFATNAPTYTTNILTVLPYRIPEVLCFYDGTNNASYVMDGKTYRVTNSLTAGLQEADTAIQNYYTNRFRISGSTAQAPTALITLGNGNFPIFTNLFFNQVSIRGQGEAKSVIVYYGPDTGQNTACVKMLNNSCASLMSDLGIMNATNAATYLLDYQFNSGVAGVEHCWFSDWNKATNGCNGFNPDQCGGSPRSNNLVVRIVGVGSDSTTVRYNHFTGIGSLGFFADHGDVEYNMFEGCGIMDATLTNSWLPSSPYRCGAQITIPPNGGNGNITLHRNYFVSGLLAHAVFGTADSRDYLFMDEDVSERTGNVKLDLIATDTGTVTITEINPKWNSPQGSFYMTNLVSYPTFSGLSNAAPIYGSGSVRVIDQRAYPTPTIQTGTTNVTLVGVSTLRITFPKAMPDTNYFPTIQTIGATVAGYYPSAIQTNGFTANMTALTYTGKLMYRAESFNVNP